MAEKESLAQLQMRDSGKPLAECRSMVESAAGAFRYYAGVVETMETQVQPSRGEYVAMTVVEPYGVVLCITPWNSPIMNEAGKVAPALAAGNAVLLKPSEDTPLLAPELVRICLEAGLPEGQLQVVQGARRNGGRRPCRPSRRADDLLYRRPRSQAGPSARWRASASLR